MPNSARSGLQAWSSLGTTYFSKVPSSLKTAFSSHFPSCDRISLMSEPVSFFGGDDFVATRLQTWYGGRNVVEANAGSFRGQTSFFSRGFTVTYDQSGSPYLSVARILVHDHMTKSADVMKIWHLVSNDRHIQIFKCRIQFWAESGQEKPYP